LSQIEADIVNPPPDSLLRSAENPNAVGVMVNPNPNPEVSSSISQSAPPPPKKPPTPFFIFSHEKRTTLKDEGLSHQEKIKKLGLIWREL